MYLKIDAGKRKEGEGVEDAEQGILDAMESPNGGAELLITLLAAGFIIGPSGSSVRAISTVSGSTISSWNETFRSRSKERKVRRVVVEVSSTWCSSYHVHVKKNFKYKKYFSISGTGEISSSCSKYY